MKFTKGDIIIPVEAVYPTGALNVDGYEKDGTLLAHPLGGGFQYRLKPNADQKFRIVTADEQNGPLWRKAKFEIEGVEAEFTGWTDGESWNGWAMPHFEFDEARRLVDVMTDSKGRYDIERDCFVTTNTDGEDEIWKSQTVTLLGNQQVKVYGVGAGSWIWDELSDGFCSAMTKDQFAKLIAENQAIQKRNPYGSEPHRKAYEAIRKAVKDFHGQDIGEYEDEE